MDMSYKRKHLGVYSYKFIFKNGTNSHWDYATVASTAGVNWAKSNGYTFQYSSGFVFPYNYVPGPLEGHLEEPNWDFRYKSYDI